MTDHRGGIGHLDQGYLCGDKLTKHMEAQRAGAGGPQDVTGGLHADHLLADRRDP